jgi:hypothetical protein
MNHLFYASIGGELPKRVIRVALSANSIPKRGWPAVRRALMLGCLVPASFLVLMMAGFSTLAQYTSFDMGIWTIPFKQNPGRFERKRFESLVAKIRSLGVKPGEEPHVRVELRYRCSPRPS